jgi:hypothetical protein
MPPLYPIHNEITDFVHYAKPLLAGATLLLLPPFYHRLELL